MFRSWRLRRAHNLFLQNCRSLKNRSAYRTPGARLLQLVSPVPLLGLDAEGRSLLDALEWLETNSPRRVLATDVVRSYHAKLGGGAFRDRELRMQEGNPLRPPPPARIPLLLGRLEAHLKREQARLDEAADPDAVLRLAVETHLRIGEIHPFAWGNGRVARLSMNHLMRRYGRGYVVYPPLSESEALWAALREGDLDGLVRFARTRERLV